MTQPETQTLGSGATLLERMKYNPGEVHIDELLTALERLETWEKEFEFFDDPQELKHHLDVLEANDESKVEDFEVALEDIKAIINRVL